MSANLVPLCVCVDRLQTRHVAEERRLEERVKHAEGAQFEARQRLLRELEVVKVRGVNAAMLRLSYLRIQSLLVRPSHR